MRLLLLCGALLACAPGCGSLTRGGSVNVKPTVGIDSDNRTPIVDLQFTRDTDGKRTAEVLDPSAESDQSEPLPLTDRIPYPASD